MTRVDGSLARKLDFGGWTTTTFQGAVAGRPALRLAPRGAHVGGPDKYKVLAHRRHQAQIKARRLLDLCDGQAACRGGARPAASAPGRESEKEG